MIISFRFNFIGFAPLLITRNEFQSARKPQVRLVQETLLNTVLLRKPDFLQVRLLAAQRTANGILIMFAPYGKLFNFLPCAAVVKANKILLNCWLLQLFKRARKCLVFSEKSTKDFYRFTHRTLNTRSGSKNNAHGERKVKFCFRRVYLH